MAVLSMAVVDGSNSGLHQWRWQGASVIWARAKEGMRVRARATRAAMAVMAREGKRARARATNGGNGGRAAIGVIVMAVAAFDCGGGVRLWRWQQQSLLTAAMRWEGDRGKGRQGHEGKGKGRQGTRAQR
jgi:hypothetical protein